MTVMKFMDSAHAKGTESYFKFTFVRHPYDRLYSGYLQDWFAAANYPKWTAAKQPIFDLIGDDFNRYFGDYVMASDIRGDWKWICFCPMEEFTHHRGKSIIDFVGRSESFAHDLKALSERLGISIEKASDENVRPSSPVGNRKYLAKYSRATIENVNRIYARDFELFGYEMLDPMLFSEQAIASELDR